MGTCPSAGVLDAVLVPVEFCEPEPEGGTEAGTLPAPGVEDAPLGTEVGA